MFFASDNTGPVHPKVMEAIVRANEGYAMPYGADDLAGEVTQQIRTLFDAPEAAVYLVALGTVANSLILATFCQPWSTIFCHETAHIHMDECNAPEFFSGGAKLTLVPGYDGKMTAETLRAAVAGEESRGVHGPQRGPVSITQATELGTAYTLNDLKALSSVAKEFGLKTHMDGARFANALVRLGCTPSEMTWKAGIDAVSFGGTKNGMMGGEAVVFFDPAHAKEFEYRRKRGAHLFSKHRFLSAQMNAYLTDDLWLDMARAANATCDRLVGGLTQSPDAEVLYTPGSNMIFANWSRAGHQRLHDAGAKYYVWSGALEGADPQEMLTARIVTDWSATTESVDQFLHHLRG